MKQLHLTVRYAREATDPGVPSKEENLTFGSRTWSVPVEKSAFVLVDCWADYDTLGSVQERCDSISRRLIIPALRASREAGMTVVHAPSPEWARNYPKWRAYADARAELTTSVVDPDWPPKDFRERTGAFAELRAPWLADEPAFEEWKRKHPPSSLRISSYLGPEPGDLVVADGDELHALCKARGIFHLFYVGFCANLCLQLRDYATRSMRNRGYNIIILRDCTTAIEQPSTLPGFWITQAALLDMELKVAVSITSQQFIQACREARAGDACVNALPCQQDDLSTLEHLGALARVDA